MDYMKHWLIERQTVYSLLALFYRSDLHIGLKFLRKEPILQRIAKAPENSAFAVGTRKMLSEMAEQRNDDAYEVLLREEYQRLFIGPGHLPAPPWESVYRTKEKLLFGDPEWTVRQFYHTFGLEVNMAEPADHLALELSFMARLCMPTRKNLRTISDLLAKQQKFLEDHLTQWVPDWANDVHSNAQTQFWRGLAGMTQGWIENDLFQLRNLCATGGRQ